MSAVARETATKRGHAARIVGRPGPPLVEGLRALGMVEF